MNVQLRINAFGVTISENERPSYPPTLRVNEIEQFIEAIEKARDTAEALRGDPE